MRRMIRGLDKLNPRELIKIGLLYVMSGKEDQRSILANTTRSKQYADFMKGLGWNVDLRTHKGWNGALNRGGQDGESAPYFASYNYEIAFHDVTRMPTLANDEKCVNKKRHVSNDHVQIVWNESRNEYKPSTIPSGFNDVHLIVTPLFNGLFRVSVLQKEKVPFFLPVSDGMVLSKQLLPILLRHTAVFANRSAKAAYVESKGEKLTYPYILRQRMIKEIYDKYRDERPFEEFMSRIVSLVPHVTADALRSEIVKVSDDKDEHE